MKPKMARSGVGLAATGGTFSATYHEHARAFGATRIDQRFEPYPGVGFDDETYRGDAYPAFGWAACVANVEVDLDTGEVHVIDVVAADDIGRVIHPVLAEGQVEGGTLQASGDATIVGRSGFKVEAETITGDLSSELAHKRESSPGRRVLIVGRPGPTLAFRSVSGDLQIVQPRDAAPASIPTSPAPPPPMAFVGAIVAPAVLGGVD